MLSSVRSLDRKSTRLNSSHTEISTLSLHDALPISKICGLSSEVAVAAAVEGGAAYIGFVFYPPSPRAVSPARAAALIAAVPSGVQRVGLLVDADDALIRAVLRSEEHTSELQSHRDLHSFPTRRSSDLENLRVVERGRGGRRSRGRGGLYRVCLLSAEPARGQSGSRRRVDRCGALRGAAGRPVG